jgi:hypothetical protein
MTPLLVAMETKETLAVSKLSEFAGGGFFRGYEPKTLLPCSVLIDIEKSNQFYIGIKTNKKSLQTEEELTIQKDDFNGFLKTNLKSMTEKDSGEIAVTLDEIPIEDEEIGKPEEKSLILKKVKGKLYQATVNGVTCHKLTKIKGN